MAAAAMPTPRPAAAPIAIDHAAAWRQPGARPAWQIAVVEHPDLPAGAIKQGIRLALHCLNVHRWRITPEGLGAEVNQKRSTAFAAFAALERAGFARCTGEYLEIIPLSCRRPSGNPEIRQSGNPDSVSPEIRTDEAPKAPAARMDMAISRDSRAREQQTLKPRDNNNTAAVEPIQPPGVVPFPEGEHERTLIERGVAPREALKFVKTIPAQDLAERIAAAEAYERHNQVEDRGALYAAAVRRCWKRADRRSRRPSALRIEPMPEPLRLWTDDELDSAANEQDRRAREKISLWRMNSV